MFPQITFDKKYRYHFPDIMTAVIQSFDTQTLGTCYFGKKYLHFLALLFHTCYESNMLQFRISIFPNKLPLHFI